jgi:ribonuclease P protein component
VVPKYGHSSVERNKLKRRLRELARRQLLTLAASCDVLVRARREAYQATFERLQGDVDHVAAQLT